MTNTVSLPAELKLDYMNRCQVPLNEAKCITFNLQDLLGNEDFFKHNVSQPIEIESRSEL